MRDAKMKVLDGGKKQGGINVTTTCHSCGVKMQYSTDEFERMIKEYEDIFGLKFSPDEVAIVCSNCRDKLFN